MKKPMQRYGRVIAATLVLTGLPAWAAEYLPAHVSSPKQYELIMENEHVLVLKMVLQPGEADVLHSHRNETVYFEKGGTLVIAEPGAEPFTAEVPDGHVMWHAAWSHQVRNSGDTEVVAIIVEDKQ